MVWGMSLPSTFGEYWPQGRFEGDPRQPLDPDWGDRLKEHFFSQTPEVQKELYDHRGDASLATHSYPYFVFLKFITEQGVSINQETPPINAIKPHEPPQYYQTLHKHNNLVSLIKLSDRIVAVEDTLKRIIERLEPRVHQFFPVEIRMRCGQAYPIQYYILVIRRYVDSFSPEDSKDSSYRSDGPHFYFHMETAKAMPELAFRKAVFGEGHLWRERRLSGEWLTCFSDKLISEADSAALRLPKRYKMKEV